MRFEDMTRTRAEVNHPTKLIVDDGEVIILPSLDVIIKDRTLFLKMKRWYNDPEKVLEIFIAIGMTFASYTSKHTNMTIDEIIEAVLGRKVE